MSGIPRLSTVEREILELLASKPDMYGLELVHASKSIKRGTVYVTLGRMEEKGWITSRPEMVQGQPGLPRRHYRVSGLGETVRRAVHAAEAVMGVPSVFGGAL